ncbi:Glycerol-3-phosphate ABC transporter, periplasmic glycerol-3-phosphate-binding protein (TC 3.A.1.1.3) [Leucobacter sp. 7(1)]|uniref:extracellular solute-binding protein n=1 Tax=Leucobacter sp. 7(1) TaxID=1255613 RepID=UPI00097E8244|nr:extracellular solute-binding protein [Leucobacter sp. 7(1)]SJN12341.1 Glycerol-3-phosphate ABC transporter, periplasmic glycerol-3-phosphate-binding protein (TC 3.A.1.1.3) [Leucobacter sp. 7(1)]
MRFRRPLLATALALAAVIPLAACSSGPAVSESAANVVPELGPDEQVEIVFESYNLTQAGVWTDTVNQLVSEFEEAHPNITVKAQPTQGAAAAAGNYVGSVQTQLLAGNPPDVAQLTYDALEYTATQLGAKPLADIVSAEELEAAFEGENPMHPNARVLADWEGKTIGMPYVFSTPVLYYNATVLEAAGISGTPDLSTWDKVEEVALQVSQSTGKPALDIACTVKGGSWCMQGLFKPNGAEVLSEDRSTIEFGSPEAVAVVERFAEMTEAGAMRSSDAAAQMEGLVKGDTAMILTTSALQGMFMQGAAAGGWTLAAAPMPAFADHEAVPTNSGSALFVLSEDPAKQRAGWELIRFLTSDRAYELITSQIGYLPLRTGLVEEGGVLADWAAANPLAQPNLDQLDRLQPWVSYPGNSYVQVDDLLATAIEEVVYYGKPAEATMTEAADRAQELIG